MSGETRDRMVEAAVAALQRRGVAGMSFTEVLATSGAARGAIYHHFPGGKNELVAEAAIRNGRDVRAALAGLPATSPRAVGAAFLDLVRPVLSASTAGGGCAVAAITMDLDDGSDELRRTAAVAFESWVGALADGFVRAGLAEPEATDLAGTLIALLEGAHVLCRAAGDLGPFDRVRRSALALLVARYGGG